MRSLVLVMVMGMWVALAGCGASGLTVANRIALGVSSAAIACDWGQTRSAAMAGWRNFEEENPIMGPRPSPGTVDLYFFGMLGLNALAWFAMPRRWKMAIPILVVLGQGFIVARNAVRPANIDLGVCGVPMH